jgi:peptide/nickel transport system permease protein
MAETTTGLYAGALAEKKRRPFLIDVFVRLVKEKPLGTAGAAIVLLLLLVGIFANWLAPYGYNQVFVGPKLGPSTGQFWLGTDQVGRDIFSRIIY